MAEVAGFLVVRVVLFLLVKFNAVATSAWPCYSVVFLSY